MSYKLVSADCDYDSGYTDGYHEGYKDGSNYIECGCDGCTFEDVEEWEMPCLKCKRNCKDYYKSIGVRAMTIDEALQILEHETAFDVRWCDEHRCGTALEMVCNELKIALEKLQWYREQDLIRREDVKNDEVLKEIALGFEREFLKTVMMIPKAEHKYSGCSYDIFCEKIDCKGCEAEPKAEYRGNEDAD